MFSVPCRGHVRITALISAYVQVGALLLLPPLTHLPPPDTPLLALTS